MRNPWSFHHYHQHPYYLRNPWSFCRSVQIADQRVLVKANDSVQLVCEAKGVEIILNFLCICIRRCIFILRCIRGCPMVWQMTHCSLVWIERCWRHSMPYIYPGLQISCLQKKRTWFLGFYLSPIILPCAMCMLCH